jgi:hypothetical protein
LKEDSCSYIVCEVEKLRINFLCAYTKVIVD